jgi:peptidoglycan/xylan/chitin deacetylase (PgdA/CDA1 family)
MFHFRGLPLKRRRGEEDPASKSLRSDSPAVLYHCGAATGRQIALTFDDGPSEWTADLLDVLESKGAKATFFVMGSAIAGREEVLRRLVAGGHELGNHFYSHTDPRQLSNREICREISITAELLDRIGCGTPTLVRPPYGVQAERVSRLAGRLGYGPTVLWTIDPRDWCSESDEIAEAVTDQAHPGAIVLLHDGRAEASPGHQTRRQTVLAVERLLVELGASGYSFVPVSKILQ